MAITEKLQQQEERAEQLRRAQYGLDSDEGGQDGQPEPTETPQHDEPSQQRDTTTEQDEPAAPEQQPGHAEQGDPSLQSLKQELDTLKAAHSTLQGKYRAEVTRVHDENRQLRDQVNQLQSQTQQAEQRAEQSEQKLKESLSQLSDEFGEDYANAFQTVAREAAAEQMQQHQQEQQQSEQERFMNAVKRNIPNFDQINQDRAFINWLQDTQDPNTGFPLQETLNQAGADRDLSAVVSIFQRYQRAQQPPPEPEPEQTSPKAPQQQVEPKRTRQDRSQAPAAPQYTAQDYQKLQQDIAMGRWKGREAEARELEKEIHAAITQ